MGPIRLDEILGRERYGAERQAIRRRLIEYKRQRRVSVGDRLSFVFENRATVWYQVQEMLWVEAVTDLDAIREELRVYGEVLPGETELSATLMIEITDASRVRAELESLIGIDRHVRLEAGEGLAAVPGVFEGGRQTEAKLSAVQYVRFPLDPPLRAALAAGEELAIVVDHPRLRFRVVLPELVRESLAREVRDPTAPDCALEWIRDGSRN